MRYLSVCSGIEAATVAWHPLGWRPVAFAEIEQFPSAVLAHHYPDVPNVGDMTKYKEWDLGTVDLLVGGTPCQSFSVAGLRKGLADPRGNLALVYCGILDFYRPRWFVWENVPGVLSSGGGRDFGSFLGALAELGYGFAYRVLDAQYFGVAQRRRRVFVVGRLGDWRPAAEVLFESDCLSGNPAPSREKGKAVASSTRTGAAVSSRHGYWWNGDQVTPALTQTLHNQNGRGGHGGADNIGAVIQPVTHSLRGEGFDASEDGTGRGTPLVPVAVDTYNGAITGDLAATLSTRSGVPDATGPSVMQPISIHPHCIGRAPESGPQGKEYLMDGSAYCMDSRGQPQAVVQATAAVATGVFFAGQGAKAGSIAYDQHIAPTLKASDSGTNRTPSAHIGMQVRRLTPVECERLQGFPDNYTAIPWRKKPASECPDGPRYKALGNSMAVPVMAWIGKRIHEWETHQ